MDEYICVLSHGLEKYEVVGTLMAESSWDAKNKYCEQEEYSVLKSVRDNGGLLIVVPTRTDADMTIRFASDRIHDCTAHATSAGAINHSQQDVAYIECGCTMCGAKWNQEYKPTRKDDVREAF